MTVVHEPETSLTEAFELELTPEYEEADPNKRSHIIRGEENPDIWADGMIAQDLVNLARDLGIEITALCGHKWVPNRDPAKHDICDPCVKIWNRLI